MLKYFTAYIIRCQHSLNMTGKTPEVRSDKRKQREERGERGEREKREKKIEIERKIEK